MSLAIHSQVQVLFTIKNLHRPSTVVNSISYVRILLLIARRSVVLFFWETHLHLFFFIQNIPKKNKE